MLNDEELVTRKKLKDYGFKRFYTSTETWEDGISTHKITVFCGENNNKNISSSGSTWKKAFGHFLVEADDFINEVK